MQMFVLPINELAVMSIKIELKIDTMKNKVLGALILISNILFFIPQSVDVIKTNGGAMGFGWIAFPFLIFINLFTIPAILSFLKKKMIQM